MWKSFSVQFYIIPDDSSVYREFGLAPLKFSVQHAVCMGTKHIHTSEQLDQPSASFLSLKREIPL